MDASISCRFEDFDKPKVNAELMEWLCCLASIESFVACI